MVENQMKSYVRLSNAASVRLFAHQSILLAGRNHTPVFVSVCLPAILPM
jgi:hypothetical protein